MDHKPKSLKFDVAVIGSGTSGLAMAYNLAHVGFTVAIIDKKYADDFGIALVNGILPTDFDKAGIARPVSPELVAGPFHSAFTTFGTDTIVKLDDAQIWNIDMRHLSKRLFELCKSAGVQMFYQSKLGKLEQKDGRPISLTISDKNRDSIKICAKLFVDATGLAGVLRSRIKALNNYCPKVEMKDLCSARQEECKIADKNQARKFLKRYGIEENTMLNIVGTNGGYSTISIHILPEFKAVSILCGTIASDDRPLGADMIKQLKANEPWIGEKISGAEGLIPIRRCYDKITADGIVLTGNAANMVFPVHGSCVGNSLIVAKMLADILKGTKDLGDASSLWKYQTKYQRSYGAVFAVYDLLRRSVQDFEQKDSVKLFEGGFFTKNSCHSGITKQLPTMSLEDGLSMIKGIFKNPRLTISLASSLYKLPLVYALFRMYPKDNSLKSLEKWSKKVGKLFNAKSDVK